MEITSLGFLLTSAYFRRALIGQFKFRKSNLVLIGQLIGPVMKILF